MGRAVPKGGSLPSEFRRLVFTTKELVEAITAHGTRLGRPLPAGNLARCEVVSEPEVSVRLEIENTLEADPAGTGSGKRHEITLEPAFVVAALLRFCMDRRIPVARMASKALEPAGERLALVLTLGTPQAGPTQTK